MTDPSPDHRENWSHEGSILFGPNEDGTGIAFDNPADAAFIAGAQKEINRWRNLCKSYDDSPSRAFVREHKELLAESERLRLVTLAQEETIAKLKSELVGEEDAYLHGAESVMCIRCVAHREIPQYNRNEATGAECPACEIEKLKELRLATDFVCEEHLAEPSLDHAGPCLACLVDEQRAEIEGTSEMFTAMRRVAEDQTATIAALRAKLQEATDFYMELGKRLHCQEDMERTIAALRAEVEKLSANKDAMLRTVAREVEACRQLREETALMKDREQWLTDSVASWKSQSEKLSKALHETLTRLVKTQADRAKILALLGERFNRASVNENKPEVAAALKAIIEECL